jgi:hypothetical protein
MSGPLDGVPVRQLLTILYIALSLALFPLGGVELIDGFCFRTLSFGRPTAIMGPILDSVAISHAVEGMICEE